MKGSTIAIIILVILIIIAISVTIYFMTKKSKPACTLECMSGTLDEENCECVCDDLYSGEKCDVGPWTAVKQRLPGEDSYRWADRVFSAIYGNEPCSGTECDSILQRRWLQSHANRSRLT